MSGYCDFAPGHPVHASYHDSEYGFPLEDEAGLFERLVLEINQAGLSWELMLKKRENFRRAYDGFVVDRVAAYGEPERARLLADAGIVRNRLKIEATRSDQPYRTMLDGPVQLANGVLQWEGQFKASARQDTERFSVKPLPVRVDGKFLLTPNQVQVPEYRLEVGASEDPYVVSGEGRANIRDKIFFTATADGRQVNLDRLGQEGEGAAPASLDRRLVALRSVIERIPVPGIDGEIDIKLPALIAGDTFIREVAARVRPLGGGWEVQSLSAKLI